MHSLSQYDKFYGAIFDSAGPVKKSHKDLGVLQLLPPDDPLRKYIEQKQAEVFKELNLRKDAFQILDYYGIPADDKRRKRLEKLEQTLESSLERRQLLASKLVKEIEEKIEQQKRKKPTEAEVIEVVDKLHKPFDFFNFKVYVTDGDSGSKFFKVSLPDIIPKSINFKNKEDVIKFQNQRMRVYQNQFNMAVWCVTAGCGISLYDVNFKGALGNLGLTVCRFHLYYQIRKIFKELEIPLPTDTAFKEVDNNINMTNYARLKKEFNISDHKDFYIHESLPYDYNPHYNFWAGIPKYNFDLSLINDPAPDYKSQEFGYMFKKDWDEGKEKVFEGNFFGSLKGLPFYNFPGSLKSPTFDRLKNKLTFDVLKQPDYPRYMKFIPVTYSSLTTAGIVRLNDSIRAFVVCILESQTGARSAIIGNSAASLIAQKHFLQILEKKIDEDPDTSASIDDYQKIVSGSHVRLDYVIGPGLYIISSDMVLKQGIIDTYNNKIKVANSSMTPGKNDINNDKKRAPPLMEGDPSKTQRTKASDKTVDKTKKNTKISKPGETEKHPQTQTETEIKTATDNHENMKFIVFGVTGALVGIALLLR